MSMTRRDRVSGLPTHGDTDHRVLREVPAVFSEEARSQARIAVRGRTNRSPRAKTELARVAVLAAEVGAALAGGDDLPRDLGCCAGALVRHLGAALARIWTVDPGDDTLVLRASSGLDTHPAGVHARVPVGTSRVGRIAREALPFLTNALADGDGGPDRAWARQEGMVALAALPLRSGGRVVGVVDAFTKHPLPRQTLKTLAPVADIIARAVVRMQAVETLRMSERRFRAIADST
jgi:two-component system NtrC family sensor kinase